MVGNSAPFQRENGLGILVVDPQAPGADTLGECCFQAPRKPPQPANLPPTQSSEGLSGGWPQSGCPPGFGSLSWALTEQQGCPWQ